MTFTALRRATAVVSCVLLTFLSCSAYAQLSITLDAPPGTPADAQVHIAGNFNNWNPGDPSLVLTPLGNHQFAITLPQDVRGFIQFKFTLGSWETVEQDANGADIANRFVSIPPTGPASYSGTVASWRNVNTWPLPNSTVTDSVDILDFAFPIPQLERTRRVWIYLPPDYASSAKRYPVLYLQDGQNVFDTATSFVGEWGVDETLDALHAQGHYGAIVVAVANGEANRANEYHPWPSAQFGGGEGNQFVDFIVDTLKPHVDSEYRTLGNPRNTGIGGSSSAGLFAFYAGVREPAVFGRVLAFSPAFFANDQVFGFTAATGPTVPAQRFALISGLNETVGGLPPGIFADSQNQMLQTLSAASYDVSTDVLAALPADGTHSEAFWRREFGPAFAWLFDDQDTDGDTLPDFADNCINTVNATQADTDADGYGNACDADLNNDGVVNVVDLGILRLRFFSGDPDADFNGDGAVNVVDLGLMRVAFFRSPGPSGTLQ